MTKQSAKSKSYDNLLIIGIVLFAFSTLGVLRAITYPVIESILGYPAGNTSLRTIVTVATDVAVAIGQVGGIALFCIGLLRYYRR